MGILLSALISTPTPAEQRMLWRHYNDVPIAHRAYLAGQRLYIDLTVAGRPGPQVCIHLHTVQDYEGGVQLCWSGGRLRLFRFDLERPWDGVPAPIRR
jgi:hypothetical protein